MRGENTFAMVGEPRTRRLSFQGAVNFRDIGGYPAVNGRRVRWGRVFRSDSLSALTDSDHRQLESLGLSTLIDFRLASEREQHPDRLHPAHAIDIVEIGFIAHGTLDMLRAVSAGTVSTMDVERAFLDHYRRFVTDHNAEFAQALAYLLDDRNLPLLLHCTSGKDRTGFAIAATLLALGTPEATIIEDYTLTNAYMRDIAHFFWALTPPELIRTVKTADARYLQAAFDQMRRSFGSTDAYLARGLQLDDSKRSRLIAALTE